MNWIKYYSLKLFIMTFFISCIFVLIYVFWKFSYEVIWANYLLNMENQASLIGVSVGGLTAGTIGIIQLVLEFWRDYQMGQRQKEQMALAQAFEGANIQRDLAYLEKNAALPKGVLKARLYELVLAGRVRPVVNYTFELIS